MVDALRFAKRTVTPDGWIVDLHPTESPALVTVGDRVTGRVDSGDAPRRHAAAGAALASGVDAGLFERVAAVDFSFHTYADTIEELRSHVAGTWRNARIGEATVEATREAVRAAASGVRPCTVERVRLTTLRPVTS